MKDVLEPLQLKRWIEVVKHDQAPTIKDPATQKMVPLRMPVARADGDGLTFTLSQSGTASWILRYRHGGRSRELTLGNDPDISLSDARKLASERRAQVDGGGDIRQAENQGVRHAGLDGSPLDRRLPRKNFGQPWKQYAAKL